MPASWVSNIGNQPGTKRSAREGGSEAGAALRVIGAMAANYRENLVEAGLAAMLLSQPRSG